MSLMRFDVIDLLPIFMISIPLVAIIGGISAGIVKTMGRQRRLELAYRERIAAIERGIDPATLPAIPDSSDDRDDDNGKSPMHRAQGLLIGGVVAAGAGIGIAVFLNLVNPGEPTWAVGIVPLSIGIALVISSLLVWPKR